MTQNRLQVTKGKMTMKKINISLFEQLNGKIFYFAKGIFSIPKEHSILHELKWYKEDFNKTFFFKKTDLIYCNLKIKLHWQMKG